MADAKIRKALEREGIKPLRLEIPDELQSGKLNSMDYGPRIVADDLAVRGVLRCLIWRTRRVPQRHAKNTPWTTGIFFRKLSWDKFFHDFPPIALLFGAQLLDHIVRSVSMREIKYKKQYLKLLDNLKEEEQRREIQSEKVNREEWIILTSLAPRPLVFGSQGVVLRSI